MLTVGIQEKNYPESIMVLKLKDGSDAAQAGPEKSIVLEKEEKKIFQEVLSELLSG